MLDDRHIRSLLLRTGARDHGSAEAFGQLYRACAPLLMGVAHRILGRRELAEEVLHDSFTRIWHDCARFDPLAVQPVAWMAAIVRNRAIDVQSSHAVSRVDSYHDGTDEGPDGALDRLLESHDSGPEDAEDRRRTAGWLRRCLEELKPAERQAIVLAYERGLSHADLAVHLQRPLGTVKAWIRRGLENLRHCVEACMGEAP